LNIPNISVDLGMYGTQEIDFTSLVRVSSDLNKELTEGAASYAYVDFVEKELRRVYEQKKLSLEEVSATRRDFLGCELEREKGKKPTVADMDAALSGDATLINLKQELLAISYQIDRIKGLATSLSMKHSNVKALSQRELTGWGMDDNGMRNEKPVVTEPVIVERKVRTKKERN